MWARTTTIHASPARVDDGIALVRDEVEPAVGEMEGCEGLSMLVDREDGRCIVTTAWRDEQAMHDSEQNVVAMRRRAAEVLQGRMDVQEWEIAVLHRVRRSGDHACARVVWLQADAAQADALIEDFRENVMPRMELFHGFCSVSLLADRLTGRAAVASIYESRDSLDRNRRFSLELRREASSRNRTQVLDVAEMDLVVAHMRVPETV